MPTPHSALSYSRWDQLDVSDDDDDDDGAAGDGPANAMLAARKTAAQHERDGATAARFVSYMERFASAEVPATRRTISARFISVADRGDEPNNIYRYNDIIACCTQYAAELLSQELVDALCELHKAIVNALPSSALQESSADLVERRDARLLMEAINTLEACRRVPNVTVFFEELCTPSRSAKARELTTAYQQLEFGKHAMLRAIFGKADAEGFGSHIAEEEQKLDEKLLGKAPVGSSARVITATKSAGGLAAWASEYTLLGCAGLILALFAAGAWLYLLPSTRQSPGPDL